LENQPPDEELVIAAGLLLDDTLTAGRVTVGWLAGFAKPNDFKLVLLDELAARGAAVDFGVEKLLRELEL